MTTLSVKADKIPNSVFALSVGSFGIGTTEFVTMGLLLSIAGDLKISMTLAAYSITAYAFGVVIGAPLLTPLLSNYRKKPSLVLLMIIFTIGNLWCAMSGSITTLIIARILTAFAHASFFGISSVYASELSPPGKKSSAVSAVFLGATIANIVGVPAGTWIGQMLGWRSAFYAVAIIGVLSSLTVLMCVPDIKNTAEKSDLRKEFKSIMKYDVLKSFLITALGFSGVFAAFTYIEPMLETVTGLPKSAMSPVLVLFGVGMVIGNTVGGKLSDKSPKKALILTLGFLMLVLVTFPITLHFKAAACASVFLLGAAMFSAIPPLQIQALESCKDAQNMASSCNIAAFNLGNAFGAWTGGMLINYGVTLNHIPLAAAVLTFAGWLIVFTKKMA